MDQKECMYVLGAKLSHLGLVFNFASFGFFLLSFMSNNHKSTQKSMFESFWEKPNHFQFVCKFGKLLCQKS